MPNDEHSSALPSFMYGDPARAYERIESRGCTGCSHELQVYFGDQINVSCDLPLRKHGKRCKRYRERK